MLVLLFWDKFVKFINLPTSSLKISIAIPFKTFEMHEGKFVMVLMKSLYFGYISLFKVIWNWLIVSLTQCSKKIYVDIITICNICI